MKLPDPFWMLRDPTWRMIGLVLGLAVVIGTAIVVMKMSAK